MYDIVCFGELLWDMLPTGKVVGGAPFNISNRASALGVRSVVITSIGDDHLGTELLDAVSSKGNDVSYIQTHQELPTSTVEVSVGDSGEPQYDIVYPVAWDDIRYSLEFEALVANSEVFVYSSLGLRDKRSREVLFQLLPHAKLKVCDINLREGHYEQETILRMLEQADIIRMNEYELQMACQWLGLKYNSFEDAVVSIAKHYQLDSVIATLGGDGAISYKNGEFYRQPVYKVEVIDTVGAGDAFLASYLTQILSEKSEPEALKYACVVGALTASKAGGTPIITTQEIHKMLASV